MDQSQNLIDVLVFLAAAIVIVPIFRKFRSSPILGYLAAGILIGPHGLAIIGNTEAAETLAEFGVVFLLFMVGLELSVQRLRTLGGTVFGLGSLQVIVSGALIGAIAWWFGMGIEAATIIGSGLALSSTAFVLQLLSERGERPTPFGLTSFSVLLFQDLAVVPLLIMVTLLGSTGSSFIDVIGTAALRGAVALVLVAGFGRYLLRPLYRMIAGVRSAELFVSTTLLVVLGMGWIMSAAGLSMALGALLAGLLLAETEYRHQIEADIRPFRGMLLGLFFITIGMDIDIVLLFENLGLISLLVVSLLVGKSIVTAGLCRAVGLPADVSVRTGLALSQGGEFGFVLFGAAMTLDLIAADVAQILLAVITLSMVATPAMFAAGKSLAGFLNARSGEVQDPLEPEFEDHSNHVLIAGFGRVGQTVAKVLSDAGLAYVALDLDQDRVARCRAMGMPVYYGDADQISVLEAAGAAQAQAVVVTVDQANTASEVVGALRGQYPQLPIYVRARDRRHMGRLEQAGATAVVSEAAESSLQLGSIVLTSLDVSADNIASVVQAYRDDDYARLEEIH